MRERLRGVRWIDFLSTLAGAAVGLALLRFLIWPALGYSSQVINISTGITAAFSVLVLPPLVYWGSSAWRHRKEGGAK